MSFDGADDSDPIHHSRQIAVRVVEGEVRGLDRELLDTITCGTAGFHRTDEGLFAVMSRHVLRRDDGSFRSEVWGVNGENILFWHDDEQFRGRLMADDTVSDSALIEIFEGEYRGPITVFAGPPVVGTEVVVSGYVGGKLKSVRARVVNIDFDVRLRRGKETPFLVAGCLELKQENGEFAEGMSGAHVLNKECETVGFINGFDNEAAKPEDHCGYAVPVAKVATSLPLFGTHCESKHIGGGTPPSSLSVPSAVAESVHRPESDRAATEEGMERLMSTLLVVQREMLILSACGKELRSLSAIAALQSSFSKLTDVFVQMVDATSHIWSFLQKDVRLDLLRASFRGKSPAMSGLVKPAEDSLPKYPYYQEIPSTSLADLLAPEFDPADAEFLARIMEWLKHRNALSSGDTQPANNNGDVELEDRDDPPPGDDIFTGFLARLIPPEPSLGGAAALKIPREEDEAR